MKKSDIIEIFYLITLVILFFGFVIFPYIGYVTKKSVLVGLGFASLFLAIFLTLWGEKFPGRKGIRRRHKIIEREIEPPKLRLGLVLSIFLIMFAGLVTMMESLEIGMQIGISGIIMLLLVIWLSKQVV